jgi:hypothetical protein
VENITGIEPKMVLLFSKNLDKLRTSGTKEIKTTKTNNN